MNGRTEARQHYRVTFAILAAGGTAYSLLQALVVPALPDIQRELDASEASTSWVLTALLLSTSVLTPIIGRLGDKYGKERVLVLILLTLAVGTLVSALAGSLEVLIAGRVIQGAGGGIFPLAFGIIRDEFPRDKIAGGLGFMSSLLGIGAVVGLAFAGLVVEHLSYHWLFWFPLALILVATVATWRFVPESPIRVPGRVNWAGAALMSAGLSAVLIAVARTEAWGWTSARTLGLLTIGLVLTAAWIRSETRSSHPLVDMGMMRIRGVWTTNVVALLVGAGMFSAFILVPQYVQEPTSTGYGFGESVVGGGLYQLPVALAMGIMGQFAGPLTRRFGSRQLLIAGCAFTALSFCWLVAWRSEPWHVYVGTSLQGVGIGLAMAALPNLIVEHVRQDQTGVATGMMTIMRTIGGAALGQVVATVLAGRLGLADKPTDGAFTIAFALCAAALVAATVVALFVPRRTGAEPGLARITGLERPAHSLTST